MRNAGDAYVVLIFFALGLGLAVGWAIGHFA